MDQLSTEIILEICEEFTNSDLARFALTDRALNQVATYYLYLREANAGDLDATALVWMVNKACTVNDAMRQTITDEVVGRLQRFGANFNALAGDYTNCHTVLTEAAWTGTNLGITWMKKLISAGASVNVVCFRPFALVNNWSWPLTSDDDPTQGSRRRLHLVRKGVLAMVTEYTCLFHPMINGHEEACKLLLDQPGTSPHLSWSPTDTFEHGRTSFSVIHALSMHPGDFMKLAEPMVRRCPNLLGRPVPAIPGSGIGAKPIHLAILSRNETMFNLLIDANVDLDVEMGADRILPLHLIFEQMRDTQSVKDQKHLFNMFRRLLEAGADPGRPLSVGHQYTPLLTLVDSMRSHTTWSLLMKNTAMLLLNYNPNPDHPDVNGNTPLDHLVWTVISEVSTPAISLGARWFIDLLCELGGADTNIHNGTNRDSLLGTVLKQHTLRADNLLPLFKQLHSYGARLGNEVNECFDLWLADASFMKLYDMRDHEREIEQSKIDREYIDILKRDNPWKYWQRLRKTCPGPKNLSELLHIALDPEYYHIRTVNALIQLDWDPAYVHPGTGTNLVAQLIRLACTRGSGYNKGLAARQCKIMIARGVSVRHKDPRGMTPVKYLCNHSGADELWDLKALVWQQCCRENGDI